MTLKEPLQIEIKKSLKSRKKRIGATLSPSMKGDANELLLNLAIMSAALFIAFRMSKDDKVTESVVPAPKNPNSPSEAELFKPYEY